MPQVRANAGPQRWRFAATHRVAPDEIVLTLTGRLGHQSVPLLEEALRSLPPSLGEGRVVIDFSRVDYLSSQALRTLVTLCARLENGGRRLTARGLSDPVRVVFELSGLIDRVDIDAAG